MSVGTARWQARQYHLKFIGLRSSRRGWGNGYHFICITDPRKRFPHREKAFLAFLIQDLVPSTLKLVKRDHRENVERTAGYAWDLIVYDSNEVRLPQLPRGTRFHTLHTGWTVCIVPTRCKVQVHFSRDSATRTHRKHCLYVPE